MTNETVKLNRRNRYFVTVVSQKHTWDKPWFETTVHGDRRDALKYAKGACTRGFSAVNVVDRYNNETLFKWDRDT
jgi:hypothetical protein